jgi:hypothetical protein
MKTPVVLHAFKVAEFDGELAGRNPRATLPHFDIAADRLATNEIGQRPGVIERSLAASLHHGIGIRTGGPSGPRQGSPCQKPMDGNLRLRSIQPVLHAGLFAGATKSLDFNSVARRPALPTAPIEVSFASAIYRAWRHPSRNLIDGERVVCRKRIAPNHEATEEFLAGFSKLRVIMPCTCHSTTYAAAMPSRS